MNKLKSKFLLQQIASFLPDRNYIYKLFVHSKSGQKQIGIDIEDYKYLYLFNHYFGLFNDYLYYYVESPISFEDEDIIKTFDYFFKRFEDSNIFRFSTGIDLSCPIFDKLSKKDYFKNYFDIILKDNFTGFNIDKHPKFEAMNKSGIKYTSIFILGNANYEKNKLNEFNIDFNQIKKLTIKKDEDPINFFVRYGQQACSSCYDRCLDEYNAGELKNSEIFYKKLFSMDNILDNLVYLKLDEFFEPIRWVNPIEMDPKIFEGINGFKSLKYLYLSSYGFKTKFIFKLYNLEKIEFKYCNNIGFIDNSLLNLKCLILENCSFGEPNSSLLKIPKLETCSLCLNALNIIDLSSLSQINYLIINDEHYDDYFSNKNNNNFNFSSLTKIKVLSTRVKSFSLFKNMNVIIEELNMFDGNFNYIFNEIYDKNQNKIVENNLYSEFSFYNNPSEENIKIKLNSIKKLMSMNIKKINLYFLLPDLNKNEILEINDSIKEMTIFIEENCNLCNLQKNLLKLNKIKIRAQEKYNENSSNNNNEAKLELIENKNLNIREVDFFMNPNAKIKLFIESYENLESFSLDIIHNLDTNFPIFNDKCNIIFSSLKYFILNFTNNMNNLEHNFILNNLFNNIDKMPNLREFALSFIFYETLDKNKYLSFIKKILSFQFINIIIINLFLQKNIQSKTGNYYYSLGELKEMFPNINFGKIKKIRISRFIA